MKQNLNCKYLIVLLLAGLPLFASAQEGRRRLLNGPSRVVELDFILCNVDSSRCDRHSAIMNEDSFITEEHLDKRLIATTRGSYQKAYTKYFEKVYEIPTSDLELLSKAEKTKVSDEQMYTIEVRENGQVRKYDIVFPKKKNTSHKLITQFNKIEALAQAIRKVQNAYDRKAIILNNP